MTLELRDPQEARQHLLSSLWLSRSGAPTVQTVSATLNWALLLAGEGHALPPLALLADVGFLALGGHDAAPPIPARELTSVEPGLLRRYEDYVLGKLYADLAFERGTDALARYAEADRPRGLAYLVERLLARIGFGGVIVNPASIRSLRELPAEEVLRDAWQLLAGSGLSSEATEQYNRLIDCAQSTGELLAPEDVFELEHGTALVEFGQRLALRQTLRAAESLLEGMPRQRPRAQSRRQQVATRLMDEDAYPVGGFSSISTKGSMESLLHSQLAYLERDERPDLFDIKFVRDELLYYSRDENQFLRRRTTVFVVLAPELAAARIKDHRLPCQRIVMAIGLVVALARKLTDWLSDESLSWRIVFVEAPGVAPLDEEQALLELLLSEEIAHGTARVERLSREKLEAAIAREARRSLVRCLVVTPQELPLATAAAAVTQLLVGTPQPHLWEDHETPYWSEEAGVAAWRDVLGNLLLRWP